jgi:ATP-dependent protease ClpP protease subunit
MFKSILIAALLMVSTAFAERTVNLTAENTVTMRGEVNENFTRRAQLKLLELDAKRNGKDYPIYLVIDSPGGSIDAGNDFIEVAKTIKNVKTITLFAASMASAIQQAIPGERLITASGVDMFHRARGGFDGQFEDGEVESRLDFAKQIVKNLERSNANRIGLSIPEYKAKVVNEWWAVGSNAVKLNMADDVVAVTCSKELFDVQETIEMQVFIFVFKLKYSGCPMVRTGVFVSAKDNDIFLKSRQHFDEVTKRFFRLK